VLLAVVASGAAAQESAPSIEKVVERANHQNPYYSAQGVKALKERGAAALPALEQFVARRSLLALAPLSSTGSARCRTMARARCPARRRRGVPGGRRQPGRSRRREAVEVESSAAPARDAPAVREPALVALGEIAAKDAAVRACAIRAPRDGPPIRCSSPGSPPPRRCSSSRRRVRSRSSSRPSS
jgi:hypothetical protein